MMRLRTHCYRQFDADYALDVPVEGYGGWKTDEVEIDPAHTAVVVMHAVDAGTREQFPGQFRCCAELEESYRIAREVFPSLLAAVRRSPYKLFHVLAGQGYFDQYAGWKRTQALAGESPSYPQVAPDPVYEDLNRFRADRCFPGAHNRADCDASWRQVKILADAEPRGDEGIARNGHELFALCKDAGVNHLIYAGFFIDWCLLIFPGGMVDMSRYGLICSAFRDAVAAVENKETARAGLGKEISLWRISTGFGFVFDTGDFVTMIQQLTGDR